MKSVFNMSIKQIDDELASIKRRQRILSDQFKTASRRLNEHKIICRKNGLEKYILSDPLWKSEKLPKTQRERIKSAIRRRESIWHRMDVLSHEYKLLTNRAKGLKDQKKYLQK